MSIQKETILDFIRSKFDGKHTKEVQYDVAKKLGLSPATAYNKLSGRNDFTLSEFLILAKEYNFSMDSILHHSENTKNPPLQFLADGLEPRPNSFLEYFQKVKESVSQANPSSGEAKATFVCLQPHVFHLMRYPFLLYLKLYTYNLINWQIPSVGKYDPMSFIQDITTQDLIKNLYNAYLSIPVTEMVGHNFIHPLCSQLEYLVKSRIIKNPDYLKQIKVDMYNFLSELEDIATKGVKINNSKNEVPVEIYINKFIHVSNIILIENTNGGLLTIQCDVPDVLKTYDTKYIKHFKEWLDSNRGYAINISKSGGLERREFFDRNIKHVDMVMNYLEKSFDHINSI